MTDIRTRLADALRQHHFSRSGTMAAGVITNGRPDWFEEAADVLLSLPGIVIVELETDVEKIAGALQKAYDRDLHLAEVLADQLEEQ